MFNFYLLQHCFHTIDFHIGIVKFHETLIQTENGIDNLLTQYLKDVKNTLNVQQPMQVYNLYMRLG